MKSARAAAVEVLGRIERDQSYSSLALNSILQANPLPDAKDAALVTLLVYGVLERRITIDYNLSLYLKSPLRKLHPGVLTILRIGAYQILFADRIPVHAAVNESVKLARESGLGYASGLVNAVLRKIAQNGLCLPVQSETAAYLSVAYSCPEELVRHFIKNYGYINAQRHLSASVGARPLFIRLNPLRCTGAQLTAEMEAAGAVCRPVSPEGCFILDGVGDITLLDAYQKGYFYVQDRSSQLTALLLGVKPGQTVVDCCAAPGGKSFTAALQMENTGTVYSCDLYEHKTALIRSGAKRLGLTNISTVCADAAALWERGISADAVLCDVPCSGFGVIGRKPEIRYKSVSQFESLPDTQYAILASGAKMVKQGGTLIYSTCTLNPAENEQVCARFLAAHPMFSVSSDPFYTSLASGDYMTVFATPDGGDGFFAAKFERLAE